MKGYKVLRALRIVVAAFMFLGLGYFFVATSAYATHLWTTCLKVQLVPALLGITSGGALTVALVLLVTLLFGRIYCSIACPLGIYQDFVIWVAHFFKSKKQRRFHYHPARNGWRYGILLFVVACALLGFVLPVTLIDPYGLFGKMATQLGRPIAYWIAGYDYNSFVASSCIFAAVAFVAITLLAAFKGRFYCNTICPVGSLLGVVSKKAMFRLSVDTDKCRHCLLCGLNCKSNCLDSKNVYIDHSRCVGCLNCMEACSENALHYTFAWKKTPSAPANKPATPHGRKQSRRTFLGVLGTLGSGVAVGLVQTATAKSPKKVGAGMPPGAGSLDRLKDQCVACYACEAACPAKIIQPAVMEFGWEGMMLPSVRYDNGFCGYECQRCQQACPSGALRLMPLEEKKRVKMGVATFTMKNCIVYKDGTDCGACDEHCPVKAVQMSPRTGSDKLLPKVSPKICIGCGGCEYICPARPKAIKVTPMAEQRVADAPEFTKQEKVEVDGFGF